ncbi:MAG TPA: hypothetical protein VK745_15485, partial [Polyangiaceae bacterium]|nr:hypothetical protein [Polyangiaceae bacterium]
MEDRRSLPPHEDELALALLRSAEHDEPSSAAFPKLATALGVGAAVGLGASLPAPAALASSGLSGAMAVRWSSSLLGKVLVGVSSFLLVAGGIAFLRHRVTESTRASVVARATRGATPAVLPIVPPEAPPAVNVAVSVTSTALSARAPAADALAIAATEPTPPSSNSSASVLGFASTGKSTPSTPSAPPVSAPRVARASSLPEQVLSLDRARVALNSGNAAAALAEISHYRSTWPKGVFLTEASVLEIEALAKSGAVALAGMRARAFVTAHPDSP